MTFQGEMLKKWRQEKKLSQAAAGDLVHVSQGFWRSMEVGTKQPSIDTLVLISQVTGFTTDQMLGNPIDALPNEAELVEGARTPQEAAPPAA